MKKILFLLAALLLATAGFAQNKVEGVVMNENSEPLAGVAVIVKGTQKGVSTDAKGYFSIDAKKGQTLTFSYIGMINQSVPVGGGAMRGWKSAWCPITTTWTMWWLSVTGQPKRAT